jgi:TRAP-type mannitol/chloroaromatic compound transport system permease small subunit
VRNVLALGDWLDKCSVTTDSFTALLSCVIIGTACMNVCLKWANNLSHALQRSNDMVFLLLKDMLGACHWAHMHQVAT